jgi:hypothetical protein
MMMNEFLGILNDTVYNGGSLLKIEYLYFDEEDLKPMSVLLSFKYRLVVVRAISDDDTVEITTQLPDIDNTCNVIVDVSRKKPWSHIVNHELQWAWSLTNQQEYLDGIQFCFKAEESDKPNESIIIQMQAIASSLDTYYLIKETISHISESQKVL